MSSDNKNKSYLYQMYNTDSEIGKQKLITIRANLYFITIQLVRHSIEMYTEQKLEDWIKKKIFSKKSFRLVV